MYLVAPCSFAHIVPLHVGASLLNTSCRVPVVTSVSFAIFSLYLPTDYPEKNQGEGEGRAKKEPEEIAAHQKR
jgi:hypothetical protein